MAPNPKPTLNADQIKVVHALVDTLIPELTGQELEDFVHQNSNGTNDEALRAYGKAGIVNQGLADRVVDKIHTLPPEKIEELGMVFKVLSTKYVWPFFRITIGRA